MTTDKWAFRGWMLLGFGLLLLVSSIPFSIWLIERSGGQVSASGQIGTVLASGSRGDTASFGDSARLEIRRASAPDSVVLQPEATSIGEAAPISAGDVASFSDVITLVTSLAPEAQEYVTGPAANVTTFTDTATLEIREVPTPISDETESSSGSGGGGAANFSDTARFVVRDSAGNVKIQGVVD